MASQYNDKDEEITMSFNKAKHVHEKKMWKCFIFIEVS